MEVREYPTTTYDSIVASNITGGTSYKLYSSETWDTYTSGTQSSTTISMTETGNAYTGLMGHQWGSQSSYVTGNALAYWFQFKNVVIPKDTSFRVVVPDGLRMRLVGSNGAVAQPVGSINSLWSVWVATSSGTFQLVTPTDGLYTAPVDVRRIVLVLSTTGMNGSTLTQNHTYWVFAMPSVIVYVPDASIQRQTEQLMSTDGSDSVVGDVADGGVTQVQRLPIAQVANQISGQFDGILNESEADGTIPFPGISLLGFEIAATNVDIVSMVPPDIMTIIRNAVTLVFVILFVHHIVNLFHAIFGIYEYGDMDEHTYSPRYTMGHVTPDFTPVDMDEELGF